MDADGVTAPAEEPADGQAPRGNHPGNTEDEGPDDGAAAKTLIAGLIALAESLSEYVASLLRLEGYRLEGEARGFVRRLGGFAAAIAVILFGLLFVCVAAAVWLSNLLDSPAAGFGIVGAVCILAGTVFVLATGRRRDRAEPEP